MKKLKITLIALCVPLVLCLVACTQQTKFDKWQEGSTSLSDIKAYVEDVTNESSPNFIPKEDRIAVTDNDGTLYGEKAPIYYDCLMYAYRVLHDPDFKGQTPRMIDIAHHIENCYSTHDLDKWTDEVVALEWQEAFAGMTIEEFDAYAKKFYETPVAGFNNITYGKFFYQPMKEIVNYLKQKDFDLYVVTGVDRLSARALVCDELGIEPSHVIGTDNALRVSGNDSINPMFYPYKTNEDIIRDGHEIIKNMHSCKILQVIQEIGKKPVMSIGNSTSDESIGRYIQKDNKYSTKVIMVLQNDNDRDNANLEKAEKNFKKWKDEGWTVVSIKDEWKTIYGENVTKN